MKVTFYLGSLELNYIESFPAPLQQFDSDFLKPVLPATRSISIHICEVDQLPIPTEVPHPGLTMKIWTQYGKEIRLYNAHGEDSYLMSILKNDEVIILAKKDGWEAHRQEFRPWFHIHLERLLLNNNALVLHSASIIVDGWAIAFTAPSGTGKTTQTNLWHRYAENVEDLNGDRTLLQKTENSWCACGFPIYGSSMRCHQRAVPIRAIVIVRQGKTDRVRTLSALEKVSLLYSELTVPSDGDAVMQCMDLLEDLVSKVPVIQLECTMERTAVETLQKYISEQ